MGRYQGCQFNRVVRHRVAVSEANKTHMNRPISFRAWHSGRKTWLHDKSYGGCHILGETIWAFNQWCPVSIDELNDVIVTQFTGLQDSKGVDIFEGDIVTYDTGSQDENERYAKLLTSAVEWNVDRWRIRYSAPSHAWHHMTVVGNVFEHPNLIS